MFIDLVKVHFLNIISKKPEVTEKNEWETGNY